MTFFETLPSNKRSMEEIADSLLSTNDAEVIAKKRENFKSIVAKVIGKLRYEERYLNIQIAEEIAEKTFDEGIVN